MKLYREVMTKYYPNGSSVAVQSNSLNLYGMAVAHAFVQLLQQAGPNPTRAGIMKAVRAWAQVNPFLLPGNLQKTGAATQFPIHCEQIMKFTNGTFQSVSGLKCGKSDV